MVKSTLLKLYMKTTKVSCTHVLYCFVDDDYEYGLTKIRIQFVRIINQLQK